MVKNYFKRIQGKSYENFLIPIRSREGMIKNAENIKNIAIKTISWWPQT